MQCIHCGVALYDGELCLRCELEFCSTELFYVCFDLDGKIIAYQNFKDELCPSPLNKREFLKSLDRHYRGHK